MICSVFTLSLSANQFRSQFINDLQDYFPLSLFCCLLLPFAYELHIFKTEIVAVSLLLLKVLARFVRWQTTYFQSYHYRKKMHIMGDIIGHLTSSSSAHWRDKALKKWKNQLHDHIIRMHHLKWYFKTKNERPYEGKACTRNAFIHSFVFACVCVSFFLIRFVIWHSIRTRNDATSSPSTCYVFIWLFLSSLLLLLINLRHFFSTDKNLYFIHCHLLIELVAFKSIC